MLTSLLHLFGQVPSPVLKHTLDRGPGSPVGMADHQVAAGGEVGLRAFLLAAALPQEVVPVVLPVKLVQLGGKVAGQADEGGRLVLQALLLRWQHQVEAGSTNLLIWKAKTLKCFSEPV